MTGEFKRLNLLRLSSSDSYRMREGFFSRQSNLTTIATSVRIKIASCLAMTTFLWRSVNGSGVEESTRYDRGNITFFVPSCLGGKTIFKALKI
jgi:hypothetical protein